MRGVLRFEFCIWEGKNEGIEREGKNGVRLEHLSVMITTILA